MDGSIETSSEVALAEETIRFYDENAHIWTELEKPLQPNTRMWAVRDQIVDNPLVLDLGCGTGRAASAFFQMNIKRMIGIDASRGMLAVARENYPDLDFRLGNLCSLSEIVSEKCDGFFCGAMFMQIPRAKVAMALTSIRSVLKPGAVGFIGTPVGTKTLILSHKNHPDTIPENYKVLLNQWTTGTLSLLAIQSGFDIIEPTFEEEAMLHLTLRAV
jgi:ubiquinone/menaquinone biosynthesis C-methylase UbiE